MRILVLGDIVGQAGRLITTHGLPILRARWQLDLVVANAENVSGGSGMSPACYEELRKAGVDAFTMGDHIYKRREIRRLFERGAPVCRPANYPDSAAGPDHVLVEVDDDGTKHRVAIISVQGRLFMRSVDCPFRALDRVLGQLPSEVSTILVDVHAEATSEKQLIGRYLAGRVSAVVGTHTHVPTADASLFRSLTEPENERSTAYLTDMGMTGPYESIIGREIAPVLEHSLSFAVNKFEVAHNDLRLSGAMIEVDPQTGSAIGIQLLHLKEADLHQVPDWPTWPHANETHEYQL